MQKMILLAMNVAPCPKRICNLHSALASYKRIQPNNFMVWHNLDLSMQVNNKHVKEIVCVRG
jgi:hypothetical protein